MSDMWKDALGKVLIWEEFGKDALGKPNHHAQDCQTKRSVMPTKSGKQKLVATSQVFALTLDDIEASNNAVSGTSH